MRESSVESHFRTVVGWLGGRAIKLSPLSYVGIPDRLAILPGGVIVFVELKRPKGGRLSKAQRVWHEWLRDNGHRVEVLWTMEQVDDFGQRIQAAVVSRAGRYG